MAMLVMSQAARMNVASRRHHGWAAQERRAAANPGRAIDEVAVLGSTPSGGLQSLCA
jgi:hypothetical protein